MLWLILGTAILAALIAWAVYDEESILSHAVVGVLIGGLVFIFGNLFGGLTVGHYDKHITTTNDMLALTTFAGTESHYSGSFFILSGTITGDNETYAGYRYYTRDDKGRISLNESAASDAYLIEDGKTVAVFDSCESFSNKSNKWIAFFGDTDSGDQYCNAKPTELHIPAGSVTTELNTTLPH
jgi:lipopolysaccharide export LptBFGC system permease protein LptF